MNINCQIHNEFEIIKRDVATGEIKERAKSYNVMLGNFWTRFLSANNGTALSYIHFGSGTATPLSTDTSLTSFLGAKAVTNVSIDTSTLLTDGIIKKKAQIRLEDTEYVDQTISEVGFAYGTSSSNLTTKSLVKDQNGNPLSITKGSGEVIDIFATFFIRTPFPFNSGKIYFNPAETPDRGIIAFLTCSGVAYLTTVRMYRGKWKPKCFSNGNTDSLSATVSYDVPNKKLTLAIGNLTAGSGNIGGIECIFFTNCIFEVPCDGFAQPALIKEVIATGDGVTKDFKCAFGRILNNGTAKLYVNDVEVAATFDYNHPGVSNEISDWLPVLSGNPSIRTAAVEFENPFYTTMPIQTVKSAGYFNLYASTDRVTWNLAASRSSTTQADVSITSTYRGYRYWKLEPYGTANPWSCYALISAECLANLVIHANDAPAAGSTVALTYQPNCIAKDAQHVVNNMSIVWTFNEYTP